MSDTESITGKCLQMCPISECIKREKNNLIHILETNPADVNRKRKGEPDRMIKSYSRSAAGQILTSPELLRPPAILLQTVEYLFINVMEDSRVPPLAKYDFINDRLRSVKQDGVVQRLLFEDWFQILPALIRFYSFSAYWYCEESSANFDQKLNKDQLIDSLLLYISNYKSFDNEKYSEINAEIEAVYLIVNNDVETVNRAILLDLQEKIFQDTLKLILDWHEKKFISVMRSLLRLPLLPACLFSALHLNAVRKQTLQVMAHAYSSKNMHYPVHELKRNLFFNSIKEVVDECTFYEIPVEDNMIYFKKKLLRTEIAPAKKLTDLNKKLEKQPLPSLLLKYK